MKKMKLKTTKARIGLARSQALGCLRHWALCFRASEGAGCKQDRGLSCMHTTSSRSQITTPSSPGFQRRPGKRGHEQVAGNLKPGYGFCFVFLAGNSNNTRQAGANPTVPTRPAQPFSPGPNQHSHAKHDHFIYFFCIARLPGFPSNHPKFPAKNSSTLAGIATSSCNANASSSRLGCDGMEQVIPVRINNPLFGLLGAFWTVRRTGTACISKFEQSGVDRID